MSESDPLDIARETFLPAAPELRQGELAPSPFHFLFTGEDYLRLTSFNSKTAVRVGLQGRVWDPRTRRTVPFGHSHTPNTNRTAASSVFPVGVGYLLNVTIFAEIGNPLLGQTFARLQVVRGAAGAYPLGTLLQGYLTGGQDLGFPGSPIVHSLSQLAPRLILGTTPAAGAELSETVPTGARWELLSFDSLFTTDATVSNRRPSIVIDDGAGNPIWRSPQPQTVAGSLSKTCYWMAGMPHDAAITADALTAGIPIGVELLAGHRVRSATEAIKAGDQYGAPYLTVREKLEAA